MNQSETEKLDLLKEKIRLHIHYMNGLLTSISGYNDLTMRADPSEAMELREKIKEAADKAYQLNQKLGEFCNKPTESPQENE